MKSSNSRITIAFFPGAFKGFSLYHLKKVIKKKEKKRKEKEGKKGENIVILNHYDLHQT